MSRSKRYTPITAITTAESTKGYKKMRAGAERAKEKSLTQKAALGDEKAAEFLEVESKPWNEWDCPRDGKHWFGDLDDPEYKKKLMRK